MTSETKARSGETMERNGEAFRERLRSHDPEALERFFELYFDSVYDRVRSLVGSTRDAEVLTEAIFQRIHRSLPKLKPGRDLGRWVLSIALKHVREHCRFRREAEEKSAIDAPAPDVVRRAFYRLPLDMREVSLLRANDDLPFATIAKILRLTHKAARSRYSSALRLLQRGLSLEAAQP